MNIEEAKKELAELTPKEAAAWAEVQKADNAARVITESWSVLNARKNELKTFIKIMEEPK